MSSLVPRSSPLDGESTTHTLAANQLQPFKSTSQASAKQSSPFYNLCSSPDHALPPHKLADISEGGKLKEITSKPQKKDNGQEGNINAR